MARTKAVRPRSKTGCLQCKERRLKCDETSPTCQRCQSGRRVCKGPQTLAPANTSCGRSSTEANPPNSSLDFENRRWIERTFVGSSTTCTEQGNTPIETGTNINTSATPTEHAASIPPKQNIFEGVQAEGTNFEIESSAVARRKGFGNNLTSKRTADAVPPPGAQPSSKRTRRSVDEQQAGDSIITSSGSIGDHIEKAKEDEHPVLGLATEALQVDGIYLQPSRQVQIEECDTVQTARMALLEINAKSADSAGRRQAELCEDDIPPGSKIEPNCVLTHSPSPNSRPTGITKRLACTHQEASSPTKDPVTLIDESHNAALPSQSRNDPNNSQPIPPSISSSTNSQQPPNLTVPVGPEQDTSTMERERYSSVYGPFRPSSTAQNGQSASLDNLPPPTYGTHRPETVNSHGSMTTVRSSVSGPLQSMAQHTDRINLPRAPLYISHETLMQHTDQSDRLNADHHPSSGTSPSDVTIPATYLRHDHQEPPYIHTSGYSGTSKQPSASSRITGSPVPRNVGPQGRPRPNELQPPSLYQPPAVTFTEDNRIESALSHVVIQSYFETFSRNGEVLLQPKKTPTREKVYPVGVIMWEHLTNLHRWYVAEMGTADESVLRFELFDAKSVLENMFIIPKSDSQSFRILKQYIWDFFWVASKMNNAPATFKVLIRATKQHLPIEVFPHSLSTTSKIGNVPGFVHFAPGQHQPGDTPQLRDSSYQRTFVTPLPAPEIIVRLQTDGTGRVSDPYNKRVLRPKITAIDFFVWFSRKTGHGGCNGPSSLRFTFKDAMPLPTSSTIAQANEDHFSLMRKDIKTQFERAKEYVPDLKEFVVVVTDPEWVSEEDTW